MQPDSRLHGVAFVGDVGDEPLVQFVEADERVVGDDEIRPGVAAALRAHMTASGRGVLYDRDQLLFAPRFTETIRLEPEGAGPVLESMVGSAILHVQTSRERSNQGSERHRRSGATMIEISEPATLITDYILSIVVLILGISLFRARDKTSGTSVLLWSIGFLTAAAAAAAGGTFHGFAFYFGASMHRSLWNVTVALIAASAGFVTVAVLIQSEVTNSQKRWLRGGILLDRKSTRL